MNLQLRGAALSQRWKALFRDYEIFVRTGGEVRFLRISAALQRRAACAVLAVLGAWLIFTCYMVAARSYDAWHNRNVAARAVAVEAAEARVARTREAIASEVDRLNRRQNYIEGVVDQMAGEDGDDAPAPVARDAGTTPIDGHNPMAREVSALSALAARQRNTIAQLTRQAETRSARAAAALAAVGIRLGGNDAMGGPFIPMARPGGTPPRDAMFQRFAASFERMVALEGMILSIPSTLPADGMNLSSGFGYRHDPFTGAGAMHAGLDFRGAYGSPIRAAAAGRIAFVGQRSGYGNVVEIDHGHGIMTRYAHLSGFVARQGQDVPAGTLIARMGSTGRSTGTHLHFEVRLSGQPVNPRRFLEANSDVLKVQADVQRNTGRTG